MVQAEQDRRNFEAERLELQRQETIAAKRKTKILDDIFIKYAYVAEIVIGIQAQLQEFFAADRLRIEAQHEFQAETSDELEQIGLNQRLILELQRYILATIPSNGKHSELKKLLNKVDRQPELLSLKRRLTTERSNLNYLLEQRAIYGVEVPLRIKNQIETTEAEIKMLEEKILSLEGDND